MNKKLQDRLRRLAPDFFRAQVPSPLSERGIEVDDGWYPVLLELGLNAQRVLKALPKEEREAFDLGQIKQKFARLTIYQGSRPIISVIHDLIVEAEMEASRVCERCGGPGKLEVSKGYFIACVKHADDKYPRSPLKSHTWEVEEVDGGPVGVGEFWICRPCGASGGPVFGQPEEPHWVPFLAGEDLHLSYDCEVAKLQVDEHNRR